MYLMYLLHDVPGRHLSSLHSSPKGWHDIYNINLYFQLTCISQTVGCICSIQISIFKNVYTPTRRTKGAQNVSNLYLSPNCWHDTPNTNIHIYATDIYSPNIFKNIARHCFYNLTYLSSYKAGKFSRKENSTLF